MAAERGVAWSLAESSNRSRRRRKLLLSFLALCICILLAAEWIGRPAIQRLKSSYGHDESSAVEVDKSAEKDEARSSQLRPDKSDAKGHGLFTSLSKLDGFTSPNRQFRLVHAANGNLILERKDAFTSDVWTRLFWSNTGGIVGDQQGKRKSMVKVDPDGVLRIDEDGKDIWTSNLLPRCSTPSDRVRLTNGLDPMHKPTIHLYNNGRLETRSSDGHIRCVVYDGVPSSLIERHHFGRLAVVITGLYRTMPRACEKHNTHFISRWPGTGVDVFVYTYAEGDIAAQEEEIRKCYGANLKGLKIDDESKTSEVFPGEVPVNCQDRGPRGQTGRQHVDRLQSQLKTLANGAALMENYTVASGTKYNMIARLRPDTDMTGAPIIFRSPTEIGDALVSANAGYAPYVYCTLQDGEITIDITDQVMYARLLPGLAWFNMYHHFPNLLEKGALETAYSSYTACNDLPDGAGNKKCINALDQCAMECLVPYYLGGKGIKTMVDYEWQQWILH